MAHKHVGCSCQKKSIGTMKRRRIGQVSSASLQKMVTEDLLPTAAGYVAGNMLVDKILEKVDPKTAEYARWIKIGVGAVLGITQKGMISKVGLGLATAGVVEFASDAIKGTSIGLLPAGRPSYFISGTDAPGTQVTRNATRVVVD